MKPFIPYEKMNKKQRRKLDSAKRGSWNGICPVTRCADTGKNRYTRRPKHRAKLTDDY